DQLAGDRRAASAGALAFDTRKSVRQHQLGIRTDLDLAPAHTAVLVAHYGNRRTTQMLSIPTFVQAPVTQGGGAIDLDRDYYGVDARWRWQGAVFAQPVSLTAGLTQEVAAEDRL